MTEVLRLDNEVISRRHGNDRGVTIGLRGYFPKARKWPNSYDCTVEVKVFLKQKWKGAQVCIMKGTQLFRKALFCFSYATSPVWQDILQNNDNYFCLHFRMRRDYFKVLLLNILFSHPWQSPAYKRFNITFTLECWNRKTSLSSASGVGKITSLKTPKYSYY